MKKLEKINNWLFDHIPPYSFFYRIYWNYIHPPLLYRIMIRFFQRLIRGWDDSETCDLGYYHYVWLNKRFARFVELSVNMYPGYGKFNNYDKWRAELEKQTKQLKIIVDDFYTYEDVDNYIKIKKDFDKFFMENNGWLWW